MLLQVALDNSNDRQVKIPRLTRFAQMVLAVSAAPGVDKKSYVELGQERGIGSHGSTGDAPETLPSLSTKTADQDEQKK